MSSLIQPYPRWLLLSLFLVLWSITRGTRHETALGFGAQAQLSGLTGCPLGCAAQAFTQVDCTVLDVTCACASSSFLSDAQACMTANCTVAETEAGIQDLKNACAASPVLVQRQATTTSTSATATASSTASDSSSASASSSAASSSASTSASASGNSTVTASSTSASCREQQRQQRSQQYRFSDKLGGNKLGGIKLFGVGVERQCLSRVKFLGSFSNVKLAPLECGRDDGCDGRGDARNGSTVTTNVPAVSTTPAGNTGAAMGLRAPSALAVLGALLVWAGLY
ncbi:hypothetical protein POSPLADRAFT_1074540 [Postia placenta MAD-698-R-SB12]|uniref:CFEM domain-containing protein n=1 Tax=Postia placenta MAD-698-R-SB12 TaxID=670580 RepID=A0A1X6MYQ4_9APHY|nr:hypothetical protein POSPLADRAFT_1074540 [Postia placenta MAD-698-R-SB12]OSX61380.1 hypothetical protein POSPLADRAFT_1074540 [Postia placenta MAD-698-R-SB12]